MTFKGIQDVMDKTAKLKPSEMEIMDQLLLMTAYAEFAELVAPLVTKYIDGETDMQKRMFEVSQMMQKIKEAAESDD